MFQLDDEFSENELSKAVMNVEKNYVIQVDDYLKLEVFTNKGERIVDPNGELLQQGGQMNQNNRFEFTYLVQTDGTAKFPIIDQIEVVGLTINQAEEILQKKYDSYYKDSFVKLTFDNKRVVVLGAPGGQVIPLNNENMNLMEVLALAGGLDLGDKANNIKVIRGGHRDTQVYRIDLSTISGMKNTMMDVEPGDVIYVEPWRRPFFDGLKDIATVMGFITSSLAFVLVLQNI